MNPAIETDAILQRLRQEFIDSSLEFLDSIEQSVVAIEDPGTDASAQIEEIQRVVHTIKGQGATFDFPAVTRIAHRMEDYMEATAEWGSVMVKGLLKFVDELRAILESGVDPEEAALQAVLNRLPVNTLEVLNTQAHREVRALLIMPQSTQRKLVAQELAACGFHVMTASTPVKAIAAALATPPTVILATEVLEEMTGHELLGVFHQINKTRESHLALLTSEATELADHPGLPEGTVILHKSGKFHEEMGQHFMEMGLFGDIA